MLAGELEPLQGKIGLAKGIKLGYFARASAGILRTDESPITAYGALRAGSDRTAAAQRLPQRLWFPKVIR